MDEETKKVVIEFLNYFEEVFDKDWNYSKEMLGIFEDTEEQKLNAKEMGLESIEFISSKGTFINPEVENESEDWGNRGLLLEKYRELKARIS